jgi:hypothetical protein
MLVAIIATAIVALATVLSVSILAGIIRCPLAVSPDTAFS